MIKDISLRTLRFFSTVNIPKHEENDPRSVAEKKIASSQVILKFADFLFVVGPVDKIAVCRVIRFVVQMDGIDAERLAFVGTYNLLDSSGFFQSWVKFIQE